MIIFILDLPFLTGRALQKLARQYNLQLPSIQPKNTSGRICAPLTYSRCSNICLWIKLYHQSYIPGPVVQPPGTHGTPLFRVPALWPPAFNSLLRRTQASSQHLHGPLRQRASLTAGVDGPWTLAGNQDLPSGLRTRNLCILLEGLIPLQITIDVIQSSGYVFLFFLFVARTLSVPSQIYHLMAVCCTNQTPTFSYFSCSYFPLTQTPCSSKLGRVCIFLYLCAYICTFYPVCIGLHRKQEKRVKDFINHMMGQGSPQAHTLFVQFCEPIIPMPVNKVTMGTKHPVGRGGHGSPSPHDVHSWHLPGG